MSPHQVTELDPTDLATEIALFRYGLIAQLVHTPPDKGQQEALLRELAARVYRIPGSKRKRVSITTLRRYLQAYRTQGFDALRPHDNTAGGEIRPFDKLGQFFDGGIGVIDQVINTFADFCEIMRRNISSHTDGNTGTAVDQQLRQTGR